MQLFWRIDKMEVSVNIETSILLHDVWAHCINRVVPVVNHELDGGPYLFNFRKIIEILHNAITLTKSLNGLVKLNRWFVVSPEHMLPNDVFFVLHDFDHFPDILIVHLAWLVRVGEPYCVRNEWNYNIILLMLWCKSCIVVVQSQSEFGFITTSKVFHELVLLWSLDLSIYT